MKFLIPIFVFVLFTFPSETLGIRPAERVELDVKFDVEKHTITGGAKLITGKSKDNTVGFVLNKAFTFRGATFDGTPLILNRTDKVDPKTVSDDLYGVYGRWNSDNVILYSAKLSKSQAGTKPPNILEVRFSGELYAPPDNRQFSRENIAFEVSGTIGNEGIFLAPSAFWHPIIPDRPCSYTITAYLPKGWHCITDGAESSVKEDGNYTVITYISQTPSDGLNFSAGPYQFYETKSNGVSIQAYFLPAQAGLAQGYLDAAGKFVSLYSQMIAPYPFPKFAIVDNFLPSGYGMPGWTLLGSEVIRLPFIKDVSLGHEVLHNWFGNSLFVDYRHGNWCEGLTAYLADYKYKADADSLLAVEYRMNLLKEYASYVSTESDYPLSQFTARANPGDRAIGYGKSLMVFHMLRNILDTQDTTLFYRMLRDTYTKYQWKPITWFTWREQAEMQFRQRLDWFFEQWINQSGALNISVGNVRLETVRDSWSAKVEILTETGSKRPYMYFLPVRGISDAGHVDYTFFINEPRQNVVLEGYGKLEMLQLDPGFELFRKIYPEEAPLTLASFLGDKSGILVVPSKGELAPGYQKSAEGLKKEGQTVMTDSEYLSAQRSVNSLWIFGTPEDNELWAKFPPDDSILEYLPGSEPRWKEDKAVPEGMNFIRETFRSGALTATVVVWHPQAPGRKCIVYTMSRPDGDPIGGTRKLTHYGKYSYLLFDDENNIRKGVLPSTGDSPMVWRPK